MFVTYRPPYGSGMHGTEWVSLRVLYWHWDGQGDSGPGNVWSGPNGIVAEIGQDAFRHRLLQWEDVFPWSY